MAASVYSVLAVVAIAGAFRGCGGVQLGPHVRVDFGQRYAVLLLQLAEFGAQLGDGRGLFFDFGAHPGGGSR